MAITGDFFSVKWEWSFIPWLALSVVSSNIHLYPDDWKNLPITDIALAQQQPIVDLVDRILAAKTAAPAVDISDLEAEIDRLVCGLYGRDDRDARDMRDNHADICEPFERLADMRDTHAPSETVTVPHVSSFVPSVPHPERTRS
jgi:hypothetical protein